MKETVALCWAYYAIFGAADQTIASLFITFPSRFLMSLDVMWQFYALYVLGHFTGILIRAPLCLRLGMKRKFSCFAVLLAVAIILSARNPIYLKFAQVPRGLASGLMQYELENWMVTSTASLYSTIFVFYALGCAVAPQVTALMEESNEMVIFFYLGAAAFFLAVGLIFVDWSPLPLPDVESHPDIEITEPQGPDIPLYRDSTLWLICICQFLLSGVYLQIIGYLQLYLYNFITFSEQFSAKGVSCFWIGVLSGAVLWSHDKTAVSVVTIEQLIWSALAACGFGWVAIATDDASARLAVIVVGLFQVTAATLRLQLPILAIVCYLMMFMYTVFFKLAELDVLFLLWQVGLCMGPIMPGTLAASRQLIPDQHKSIGMTLVRALASFPLVSIFQFLSTDHESSLPLSLGALLLPICGCWYVLSNRS